LSWAGIKLGILVKFRGEGVTPYIHVSNDEHENARKKEILFTLAHMSWSIISVAVNKKPCSLHYEYLNSPNILPDLVY
jgi:hypothetical protein